MKDFQRGRGHSWMAQRAARVFKRKGNQERKEVWSTFLCVPSSSHWICFCSSCHPVSGARQGFTGLDYSSKFISGQGRNCFTFWLFLDCFWWSHVTHRRFQEAAAEEKRREPVMSRALWETMLGSSACASSFQSVQPAHLGVLLSPLHREGNSSSEELGNLPQITGLKGDRTHIQIQIFLSLKKAFHRTAGLPGIRPSSVFGKCGRTVCFLNCDMTWHRKI